MNVVLPSDLAAAGLGVGANAPRTMPSREEDAHLFHSLMGCAFRPRESGTKFYLTNSSHPKVAGT